MTHYHECAPVCCGIPINRVGGGYARTGQAYADIVLVHNNHAISFHVEGNFLGSSLSSTLIAGRKYDVELYLSLMDSVSMAGRNVGVYFSPGQPPSNTDHLLSLEPQIRYEGGFLTDKEGWMKVEGSFIAQGGEKYMTIGNFDGYFNSDTLYVGGGGVPHPQNAGYWELAAYFIDDVSVVEDRAWTGIEDVEDTHLRIWPNPASESITIETEYEANLEVFLYDMAGREVFTAVLRSSKETIGIGHLPAGVYTVAVVMLDGSVVRQRLVKQ